MPKGPAYAQIGWRLREARFKLGFRTQAEFGKGLGGFCINRVCRAEHGTNLPPVEILIALAERGVNVNYLLTGTGPLFVGDPRGIEERLAGIERAISDNNRARGRAE